MSDPKIGAQPHETPKTHPADDGPKGTPNAQPKGAPAAKPANPPNPQNPRARPANEPAKPVSR